MRMMKLNGRPVSKLILGSDYFGTNVDHETAFSLMDRYFAAGGNAIDTARMYASWLPGGSGASERCIGEWMEARRNRADVFLITKGGARDKGDEGPGRLSRAELERDLSLSLEALRVDGVDLYFLHRDDPSHPVEDVMETLASFVERGAVKAVGCSNWKADRVQKANVYAKERGLPAFSVSEIQWSLAASTPEAHEDPTIVCMDQNEYDFYRSSSLPVFAFSSQAKGFFARGIAGGMEANNDKAIKRFRTGENLRRLERVRMLSEQKGVSPSAIVLGFITSNPLEAAAIIGPKRPEQLEDSLSGADFPLTPEEIAFLEHGSPL